MPALLDGALNVPAVKMGMHCSICYISDCLMQSIATLLTVGWLHTGTVILHTFQSTT